MKKSAVRLLFILICLVFVISCSDDDDNLQSTGVNGKPGKVSIKYSSDPNSADADVFFYYQRDKLARTKQIKGSILDFNYENNELVSVYTSPEDKEVADGHGSTKFRREGSKITIESWGEPSSDLFRWELELDENNIPVKITEIGVFSPGTTGELSKVRDGKYYAAFVHNQTTKNLVKQTVYNISTSQIVSTYEYEYDNNQGAISKIDLPLWYYAYKAYINREYRNVYNRLFFNYSNNIQKETADTEEGESVVNYSYQYNKSNTPASMGSDMYGLPAISITY